MATVQNISDKADLYYTTSYTDAQKVTWLNEVQREIFMQYPHLAKYGVITVEADTTSYDLPTDCAAADFLYAELELAEDSNEFDPLEYRLYHTDIEDEDTTFCTIDGSDNFIFINDSDYDYTDYDIRVYFCDQLSSSSMSTVPDLPVEFHDLLTHGLVVRMAIAEQDIGMINTHQALYDRLYAKF